MEKKTLEIGDVIYGEQYGRVSRYEIERVTAKQAISGAMKFQREIIPLSNQRVKAIGTDGFGSPTFYYLERKDLKEKWLRQQAKQKVGMVDWSKLPLHKVEAILELIKA